MSSEPTQDENWNSCPSGLIFQTAELRLQTPIEQHKRRRLTILWSTVLSTILLMLVSYSFIEAKPIAPIQDASINCQLIQGNLAAFCNNQIQESLLERKICKHLFDCEMCRQQYRSICESPRQCPNRARNAVVKPPMFLFYK